MNKILIDEATVKLVLEALETERDNYQDWDKEDGAPEYIYEAITALKALAEQPAQQEPESECNPQDLCAGCRCKYAAQPAEQPAQQEPVAWLQIGVGPLHEGDVIARTTKPKEWNPEWWKFEPLYTSQPAQPELTDIERHKHNVQKFLAKQPAQQAPLAWGIIASNTGRICQVELDADRVEGHNPKHIVPLYTTPQPAQRTWVGLTPEWYALWIRNNYQDYWNIATLCDEMTKAAHNIKENT